MSRSLAQQSGLLNDYQNEKAALMGQLNAMKGVCTSSLSMLVLDVCHPSCPTAYKQGPYINSL